VAQAPCLAAPSQTSAAGRSCRASLPAADLHTSDVCMMSATARAWSQSEQPSSPDERPLKAKVSRGRQASKVTRSPARSFAQLSIGLNVRGTRTGGPVAGEPSPSAPPSRASCRRRRECFRARARAARAVLGGSSLLMSCHSLRDP